MKERASGVGVVMVTVDLTVEAPAREWGETSRVVGGGVNRCAQFAIRRREAWRVGWGLFFIYANVAKKLCEASRWGAP